MAASVKIIYIEATYAASDILKGARFCKTKQFNHQQVNIINYHSNKQVKFRKVSANEQKEPIYFYISCIDIKIVISLDIALLKELSHEMD